MFKTLFHLCALALTLAPLGAAADSPFAGTWKLNRAKSDFTGQTETITSLGGDRYKFVYGSAIAFVIKTDGTDQPSTPGSSIAITPRDANTWKVVFKNNGGSPINAVWTLAPDGKTVSVDNSGTRPDGSAYQAHFSLKRVGGGSSGFAGVWQVTEDKSDTESLLRFEPSGSALQMSYPHEKAAVKLTLDGRDATWEGPSVPPDSTTSATRVNAHELRMTDKLKGKVMDTVDAKVSADGKMLTLTEHDAGVKKPTTSVYDKQ